MSEDVYVGSIYWRVLGYFMKHQGEWLHRSVVADYAKCSSTAVYQNIQKARASGYTFQEGFRKGKNGRPKKMWRLSN